MYVKTTIHHGAEDDAMIQPTPEFFRGPSCIHPYAVFPICTKKTIADSVKSQA